MYKSKYANLIQHLMNEHDLILLDSEQQEIEKWIDKDLTEQCNIPVVVVPKGMLCDETESNRQNSRVATYTEDSKPEDYA